MKKSVKTLVQKALISTLGFSRYLYFVSYIRIRSFSRNKKQKDFSYFVSMIPDGGVILDIGANIGVITWYLAKEKKTSQIHSFEPIPHNFQNLKKVVKKYHLKNVTTHNIGLGEKSNTLEMIMPEIKGVKRHALCQVYDENSIYHEGDRFKISIENLDGLKVLKNAYVQIKAIKIDVEDYEYAVFMGGLELIKKHRPIIFCEFWESENKYKIIELFKKLNYEVKIYSNNNLTDFEKIKPEKGNFFLIPMKESNQMVDKNKMSKIQMDSVQ